MNGAPAPDKWAFGETYVHTSTLEKYLAVKFDAAGGWAQHFDERVKPARATFNTLRTAGLVGGHNNIKVSAEIVALHVWPNLDSGRVATTVYSEAKDSVAIRLMLDTFQHEIACAILNIARSASSDAVLAELGWLSDILRSDIRILCLYSSMLANELGLRDPTLLPPFMTHVHRLIRVFRLDTGQLGTPHWKELVKQAAYQWAASDLKVRIDTMQGVAMSFPARINMKPMPYLCIPPFTGRQIVTQVRLNCLPIGKQSSDRRDAHRCPCCLLQLSESREHLMFQCSTLQLHRQKYSHGLPTLADITLTPLQKLHAFLQLTSDPLGHNTAHILTQWGAYLHDLWRHRNTGRHFAATMAEGTLPY